MLFVIRIEGNREEQLDVRLRMVNCRCPDVSLAFVLNVPLDSLLDLQDILLGQVLKHGDGFGLPPDSFRLLKES